MTTADHAKRLGAIEGCSAGNQRDGLLAGVDNITSKSLERFGTAQAQILTGRPHPLSGMVP